MKSERRDTFEEFEKIENTLKATDKNDTSSQSMNQAVENGHGMINEIGTFYPTIEQD